MDLAQALAVAGRWTAEGKKVAAATLIRVQGPAPRPLGSRFLVSSAGDMAGSVSGGCVENDVFIHAQEVLASGLGRVVNYGIADDVAFEVGLSCGGLIDVFIEPWDVRDIARYVDSGRSGAFAGVFAGASLGTRAIYDGDDGFLPNALPDNVVAEIESQVRAVIATERPTIAVADDIEIFIEPVARPPRLVIFGAVEIGQALCALAARTGFAITVCDPRAAFTTSERFPDADEVIVQWPEDALEQLGLDKRTFVVILSHDPRYEDPVLKAALAAGVRYLGAMGSRKTHRKRLERLIEAGVPPLALDRIHGPIGLDLGAGSAEEVAVEILAEMVQARHS